MKQSNNSVSESSQSPGPCLLLSISCHMVLGSSPEFCGYPNAFFLDCKNSELAQNNAVRPALNRTRGVLNFIPAQVKLLEKKRHLYGNAVCFSRVFFYSTKKFRNCSQRGQQDSKKYKRQTTVHLPRRCCHGRPLLELYLAT